MPASPTSLPHARRVATKPIVPFGSVAGYGPIFNAGVIMHDGIYHLFARGVRTGYQRNTGSGPRFCNYISDVLVFTSRDGLEYRFQQVLARSSPAGVHSYEDPRVQRVATRDGERVVMSFTSLPAPGSGLPWRIGVQRLRYAHGCFALNRTSGRVIGPPGLADKDAVMFNLRDGRVALIHRIHPDMQLAVFASLDELWSAGATYWDRHLAYLEQHTIIRPRTGGLGVGAGAPPITTPLGLLLFFHEREANGRYTTRVALLDPDTGRAIRVLDEPILEPSLAWEREGDVDEVVFVQGAVRRADGTIYLTYGAADRAVGAAVVREDALLTALCAD